MVEEKIVLDLWNIYALLEFCDRMNISLAIDAEVTINSPIEVYCEYCNEPFSIYEKTCSNCEHGSYNALLSYWEEYQTKQTGFILLLEESNQVREIFELLFKNHK
ncbi:MAG: hypothetical protein FK732_10785, partial [Asgard group archaeon]|nr:hypothetical protein [Asgard group archaeon]